jgi:hypothetical protein
MRDRGKERLSHYLSFPLSRCQLVTFPIILRHKHHLRIILWARGLSPQARFFRRAADPGHVIAHKGDPPSGVE